MSQQLSPFIEAKYGWSYGESAWNGGMDENLLKFSFMFDRNVDGIVSTLPTAVNGKAYFLTTDNRLYFAVGNTYYSTPTPKYFNFIIRDTGVSYVFDGTSATIVPSNSQLNTRLSAVELTVSGLGTASTKNTEFFASQTDLTNATNALNTTIRTDLANTTDVTKGVGLIGRSKVAVATIKDLLTVKKDASQIYTVARYYSGGSLGGGDDFIWNPATAKSNHNGGTIISDTVPWDGTQATIAAFLAGTGETSPGGTGCFERRFDVMTARKFGAIGNGTANDLAAWQKVVSLLGGRYNEINGEGFRYNLGAITVNEAALMTIQNKDNWKILGNPRFLVTNQLTTSPSLQYTAVFDVVDCNNYYIEAESAGDVFDKNNASGPVTVNARSLAKDVSGGRVVAKVSKGLAAFQTRRVSAITTKRLTTDPKMSNVTYDVESIDAEYGVRLVGTGDDFVGNIKTLRVGRSFFPTGVSNHIAFVNSEAPYLVSDILIKAYADNVSNIQVFFNQRGSDGAAWPVTIEHQNDTDDTRIDNIHIHANVIGRINPRVFVTGETTRETYRVGCVFDLAGNVKTSSNCVTDNIFLYGAPKSAGVVSGIRDPILNLPTVANTPGRINVDFVDSLRTTKGFTIVRGDTLRAKASGSLAANPVRIELRNCFPSGGIFRVDTHINADFADTNMANSLTRGDILYISMDSTGAGSVVTTSSLYSGTRGTAPTVTYTISAGQLVATGSGSTSANTEINVVVQPLSGRFI